MLQYELTPIIFIICNQGYTVERYVHGWEASYNDIKSWNYTVLPKAFDAEGRAQTHQVKTRRELGKLFQREDFNKPSRLQVSPFSKYIDENVETDYGNASSWSNCRCKKMRQQA